MPGRASSEAVKNAEGPAPTTRTLTGTHHTQWLRGLARGAPRHAVELASER
jgi:hypothetical protein